MDEKVKMEMVEDGRIAVASFETTSISNANAIAIATKQIKEFIEKDHPEKVIFDFGRVKFFSSQVLGLLLDLRAQLEKYNGEVVISAINPQLYRVFKITNLDKVFKFFPDKESAVKAVSAK